MNPGSDTADNVRIFDRRAVQLHRNRAALAFANHDFLFREVADRLADRLADINRTFDSAAEIGARGTIMLDALTSGGKVAGFIRAGQAGNELDVVADEEYQPFAGRSLDLVVSNLSLHWTNDLPGTLIQIRRALKPDGVFLASLLGGDTLVELRQALIEAEIAVTGGVSPRVSPFADLRDAAALLQRAGFALPVADLDTITVTYEDAFSLMHDLRGMGETNAVADRSRSFTRRSILLEAAARYAETHQGADGRIPATFQTLFLSGWAPHESQQKPLAPGSAVNRLADALDTEEIGTGEKPPASENK